jgi:hypothetical protein
MRFTAEVEQTGGTTTGIEVPAEVVDALGGGRRPAVRVTINGATYRTSVASMGGRYLVSVSAQNRALTCVHGGDVVEVELVLDTEPRTVEVPADLRAALDAVPEAAAAFDRLPYSHQRQHVEAIAAAKQPATRQRRIDKAVAMLLGERPGRAGSPTA